MTKQTAIYARQSVDKKESLSIEGQIDKCKSKLSDDEKPLAIIYKDKGFSGKNTDRPQFQKLLEDIRKGEISKDDYDKWRYNYPKYDTSGHWVKVPSKELSDALIEAFKDIIKE